MTTVEEILELIKQNHISHNNEMREFREESRESEKRFYRELRDSEKKSDKKWEKFRKDLVESKKEFAKEMKESRKKFDEELKKSREEFEKKLAESRKEFNMDLEESRKEFNERQKQSDERQREADERQKQADERQREADERRRKADEEMKELKKIVRGMGLTQGGITELTFSENFKEIMEKMGKKLNEVFKNIYVPGKGEFDIVGVNGEEVYVGEIKTNLKKYHIDDFTSKRLPKFKKLFPEYKNYKLYGIVGGSLVKKEVVKYAFERGLYVIQEDYKGRTKILNEKNFKLKEFEV